MGRKKRVHYKQAIYHVMLRGNYRQNIFHDDCERNYFYSLLQKITVNYLCKIHVFCLMTNHVHLILEVNDVPLSKIMQSLNSNFAYFNNKKNNRIGHLFQSRYKAKLVQNEKYLLEVCYYIHFNPLKAKMVTGINDYPWSSHLVYLGDKFIPWVTTEYIQAILSNKFQEVSNANENDYISFINNKDKYLEKIQFCEFDVDGILTINDKINNKVRQNLASDLSHLSISQITKIVCLHLNLEIDHLTKEIHREEIILARSIIAYFSHYFSHYYITEIAYYFDCHAESISRMMHRELRKMHEQPHKKMLLNSIERNLKQFQTDLIKGFSS